MSRRWKESMINMWEKWAWILLTPSFSTSGRTGPTANLVYKRIVSMIAQKHDKTYSETKFKPSYSLLHSAIMCLGGARSSIHHPATSPDTMDLACYEGLVPLQWTEPINTQPPCTILFVISLDWLNEFPFPLKEIYMVKIRAGWHLIKLWTSHELIRTCKVSHCGNYFLPW